jgi:aspartate racemase
MIGIVGGIGPYAGIDLLKKVFDNTLADNDQEHLDTVLLSMSSKIEDRTQYLIGKVKVNPAYAIAEVLLKLQEMGSTVAGIPCNTAHSKEIFSIIRSELKKHQSSIKVLHMINETTSFIATNYPNISKIGVLSTTGTYNSGIYKSQLLSKGYEVVVPQLEMQEKKIHPAIYDPAYGIKAISNPIHPQARKNLMEGALFLKKQGAQLVILGCTEMPLAITETKIYDMVTIDPTNVLARSLIQYSDPNKLKPLKN